jgi:hypothetical protein
LVSVEEYGFGGTLGLHYPFAGSVEGYMQAGYAYMPVRGNAVFDAANQLDGRAGLEWLPPWPLPLSVGAGVSILFVRGIVKSGVADSEAMQYLLYDNESEFGTHAQVSFLVWKGERLRLGLRARYTSIWTLPRNTAVVNAGVFVGY